MGDALGHVTRALIVAQELPHHEFVFVGGGKVHQLKAYGYHVEDVSVPGTFYRDNKVDIPATVSNALKVFLGGRQVVERLAGIIAEFDPHIIMTDYEYFTPQAAQRTGRYCISLDHQHVVTHTAYDQPKEERLSRFMTSQSIRRLYSQADYFLITSFFRTPPLTPRNTEVFPPVLRRAVTEQIPTDEGHILVYQTSPTFHRLTPLLQGAKRQSVVYGYRDAPSKGNILFRQPSADRFLDDLASCSYVITNGGHNVISEALYLGKPVLSFPIANAYEQFLNAHFLDRLGYGACCTAAAPPEDCLTEFDSRLDEFKARIDSRDFFGNDLVRMRLEQLISGDDIVRAANRKTA
jgi:uncharacterized protein (TIGR00661 family)